MDVKGFESLREFMDATNQPGEIDEGIKSKIAKGLAGAALAGSMMGTPKQTKARDSEPERMERTVSFSVNDVFKKNDRRGNLIIGMKKAARIDEPGYSCDFYRVEKRGKTGYFVLFSIVSKSAVPTVNKGFTMVFADGTKIERPKATIETTVYSVTAYEYIVQVQVSQEEAEMLANKALKGYKFHAEDEENEQEAALKGADAKDLQEQVYVIMNVKP